MDSENALKRRIKFMKLYLTETFLLSDRNGFNKSMLNILFLLQELLF